MKYILSLIFCLGALNVSAQQTFTEKLQQVADSVGRIILHQEKSITDLVNGALKSSSKKKQVDGAEQAVESQITIDADVHISHKAAAERLKELASCMVGVDEEFYVVALWRHIAIDVDVREWPFLGALAFEWECRLHGF